MNDPVIEVLTTSLITRRSDFKNLPKREKSILEK